MEAFHNLGIVHKDIKLDNIFIETNAFGQIIVKIGDFGTSFQLKQIKQDNSTKFSMRKVKSHLLELKH